MRLLQIVALVIMLIASCSHPVQGVTLTFDDIPEGPVSGQYWQYGVWFDSGFSTVDHTGSLWGPPRSGGNVLVWSIAPPFSAAVISTSLSKDPLVSASKVAAYFSTEPGVVLEMIGYRHATYDPPVASAVIGAPGQSWTNTYVEITSLEGIGFVELRPVTEAALSHFCADDMSVEFVPEPSSLLTVGAGALGLAGACHRRRRRAR